MWMKLIEKLASILTIPILNWVYEKVAGLLSRLMRDRANKKELEVAVEEVKKDAAEMTEKTNSAQTKEELKRAAENTARNY